MKSKSQTGFTLIEMALALLIMGLVVGGGLNLMSSQMESQKLKETQAILEEAKNALIGFAVVNGRFPRPAVSGVDGTEQATCADEAACTGLIPWVVLGTTKLDSWGKMLRYSVTPAFANANFKLTTPSTKIVQTRDNLGAVQTLANLVPAVIYSHGKSNFGTTDAGTAIPNLSLTNLDEITNDSGGIGAVAGTTFMQRTPSENTAAAFGGEFDDIVIWLSPNILFNRMVQAGQLP